MATLLHVEIEVPTLRKEYEFSLNEHVPISAVIDEVASIIGTKEKKPWQGNVEELLLCSATGGHMLPRKMTLYQCKVKQGSRLILV